MGTPEDDQPDEPDDDGADEQVEDDRRRPRGPRTAPQRRPLDTWGNSGP